MTRKLGKVSLTFVALAAVGMLVFVLLGTATGVASAANGRAWGLKLSLGGNALLGPLPDTKADINALSTSASLLNIETDPLGAGLIDQIAALHEVAKVNLSAGTAYASSDTARVALLKTAKLNLGLGSGGLGGVVGGLLGGGVPAVPGVPGVPAVPGVPGVPGVPAVPGAPAVPAAPVGAAPLTFEDQIELDAIHGVMDLSCATLSSLGGMTELERLNTITKAKDIHGSKILRLDIPALGIHLPLIDAVTDNLGSVTDDHAAGLHVGLLDNILGLGVPVHIGDVWLYEVTGSNLGGNPATSTISAAVDMVHVRLLGGLLPAPLDSGIDIRLGHAEASLTNCTNTVTPPQPPVVPKPNANFSVDVTKLVESIGGIGTITQNSLTAKPGNQVEYSLSIFNHSLTTCAITKVVDTLPAGFTYVSDAGGLGSGVFDPASNTVTWDNLALANQLAAKQGLVVRINTDIAAGDYVNIATATGSCGTFVGHSAPIHVAGTQVLGTKFTAGTTPRTGLEDQALYIFGAIFTLAAAGGTRVLRRR